MHIGIAAPIATEYIAHLLDGDPVDLPYGYGGAPLIGTLIDGLIARGHRVTAFTTSSGLPLPKHASHIATGKSFTIHYAPVRPRAFFPVGGLLGRGADAYHHERLALERAIRDVSPDVIHAHWTYEFGLAALASGLPHIITCHDAPLTVLRYMPNLFRLVRYFMARRCLARALCVTAVSPYLKDALQPITKSPIHLVPNPLSLTLTERSIASNRLPRDGAPVIVMVANGWSSRKNPIPAIEAFSRFRQTYPQAKLNLFGYGYGPGEEAERWAIKQGIDEGIKFVGKLPYGELLNRISEADAMIQPSLEETFGMSIAEAMALGVPVIGGEKSGAVPWVIGGGGVLADVSKPDSILAALIKLLHPGSYQHYRHSGITRVRNDFSVNNVAAEYERLYFEQHRNSCNNMRIFQS